jgi:chlorite dismutase
MTALCGAELPPASRLSVDADDAAPADAQWGLRGFVSNTRYATRVETTQLRQVQQGLARPEARHAALIPIRKIAAWWDLPQDERRAIFEETSHHTQIGMDYLPAIARRLYHSRDLGEPFDFLTWFEYAPEHGVAFDELLSRLRATKEWEFVDREVDIRLVLIDRANGA